MIYIEPGLYLRVQQAPLRPHPLPLESGFSKDVAYRALGIHSPSETGECDLVLANDRDEIWFISNRHLRVIGIFPERSESRFATAGDGNVLSASSRLSGARVATATDK